MYNTIINPMTNRLVNTNSIQGQKIINNYLTLFQSGGTNPNTNKDEDEIRRMKRLFQPTEEEHNAQLERAEVLGLAIDRDTGLPLNFPIVPEATDSVVEGLYDTRDYFTKFDSSGKSNGGLVLRPEADAIARRRRYLDPLYRAEEHKAQLERAAFASVQATDFVVEGLHDTRDYVTSLDSSGKYNGLVLRQPVQL